MSRETLTVRVEQSTRKSLDRIAAAQDRERSYIVNEALAAYIDVHAWQAGHIRQGLREADEGKLVPHEQVLRAVARLKKKR